VLVRFEQQVVRYPDYLAIKSKTKQHTYAALNRLANQIAHAILARLGLGEEPVALLCEHDVPVIAALLGVLKAGKCYLPLDPLSPLARTAFMLADSGARIIVTDTRNVPRAYELASQQLVVLDIDALDQRVCTEKPGLSIPPDPGQHVLYVRLKRYAGTSPMRASSMPERRCRSFGRTSSTRRHAVQSCRSCHRPGNRGR
jgi:non-ribosomal peptide synthetase component F